MPDPILMTIKTNKTCYMTNSGNCWCELRGFTTLWSVRTLLAKLNVSDAKMERYIGNGSSVSDFIQKHTVSACRGSSKDVIV